ncbi:glycosyltransferase family 2 protein [Lutimonas sp.]|uniref:glycosyltransferase family 2 protein n=1 Tax=Lutimonas sp. TaxID=1872403 RepID=UPI003D9B3E3F
MSNQKVSVITPLFNSEKYIAETIDSVLKQSYKDFEMIIIDDYSEDNSIKIVKEYSDPRIHLICLNENSGAGVARNKGIEAATGRYIAFLDSDDLWVSDKLEKQLNFMNSKNISFCFSSFFLMDEKGVGNGTYRKALTKVDTRTMLRNNYIGCLTSVYDTQKFGKVYMSTHKKRQDWGLWLKLLSQTQWAESIDEPLAYYRYGNKSLSNNKWKLLRENYLFYRNQVGLSTLGSVFRMISFLFFYFEYKINFTKAM